LRTKLLLGFLSVLLAFVSACGKQQVKSSSDSPETSKAFDVAQAMNMFYGNYDAGSQTSTVTFSNTDSVQTRGEPMVARPLYHLASGSVGAPKFVLLMYAVPKSDEEYYCHACAPTIGMALFSHGASWTVDASNRSVTDAGEFGKPPHDIELVQIGPHHQAIKMIDVGGGNGETTSVLRILVPWNRTVTLGMEKVIADDNSGSCGPDGMVPCYSNHRTLTFLKDDSTEYYDLHFKLVGTDLPLIENTRFRRARNVQGSETLAFKDGKFVQLLRQGDVTFLENWVAKYGATNGSRNF